MAACKKLAILGKGCYGTVYLAAVILPPQLEWKMLAVKSSTPLSVSICSMQKEKRMLELFKGCKEIVECYFDEFSFEREGFIYNLYMEFATHGCLWDLICKGPLPDDEVRMYTHMILKGLSCIHTKGVVHCDLKPENILLFPSCDDGGARFQLKIADFGLSREESKGPYGEIKFRGTPFYMSPESILGEIVTVLDVWSLGCIVIEMITGFHAWWNIKTQRELMFRLGFLEQAPIIPNGLSWDCQHFLSKCFQKDPRQRWSAAMLLDHPFLYSASYNMQGYLASSSGSR
ncbi:hypothetical protein VNO78_06600 [Psophocarpus tetragonolobus]|uniref:Protein kinase domain-containing protein n=1 Tax=Psophocarpus tetragonolobus TaxID=3891 RepID=A0AAN9XR88_PSOTE